jgi:hypothetical protein
VIFGSGIGTAYIFAAHNGFVSAMIEFDARMTRTGRQIVQRTVSYIDGPSMTTVRAGQAELNYRNFLQYKAVRPGAAHKFVSRRGAQYRRPNSPPRGRLG